jgi:hypothetical protein
MIKRLIKLSNDLDSKGLIVEADTLDLIITKVANDDWLPKPKDDYNPSREESLFGAIEGIAESIKMAQHNNSPLETLIPYIYNQIKPFLSDEILSEG